MKNLVLIQSVALESPEYYQAWQLRQKYLREPLGLVFTPEDLEQDRTAYHIVAHDTNQVIGCVLGIQNQQVVKIRQMLVIPEYRHQGIGSLLLAKIEQVFCNLGINHFYLHARLESLEFYLKNGYEPVESIFLEVGIPHQRVDKFC